MTDVAFEHPRLTAMYDALDPDRRDLEVYAALVDELGAHTVLDIGCGTGTFALLLASRGLAVTAVDPAAGMLDVARAKPGAELVTWLHCTAAALPAMQLDLAVMTGNVAQAIIDPGDWVTTLRGTHDAMRPGGHLVLEARDPARRQWEEWNRATTWRTTDLPGVGAVESWYDLVEVHGSLVTFRGTCVFVSDGAVLTSESSLRFRERDEVRAQLEEHGYVVTDVRDAPDRPGRELVFVAQQLSR